MTDTRGAAVAIREAQVRSWGLRLRRALPFGEPADDDNACRWHIGETWQESDAVAAAKTANGCSRRNVNTPMARSAPGTPFATVRGRQPAKRQQKRMPKSSGGNARAILRGFVSSVHDLRHTFGRRLRAAGVSEEDRADLLGHTTGSMPTWYAQAEIDHLVEAANKACDGVSRPLLRVVC